MYKNDAMAEKLILVAQKIKRQFTKMAPIATTTRNYEDNDEVTEITPLFIKISTCNNHGSEKKLSVLYDHNECATKPSNFFINILRWPITLILWCSIPDCRRYKKFYVLTFINCVIWILLLSYLIASLITVVGKN